MRVDGLLVSVSQQPPDLDVYDRVRAMRIPLVFFDRRIEGLPFSSVTVDDEGGARHAIEFLIEKGDRKIAHIAGTAETEIGRSRRRGYEQALLAHGIELYEPWIIEGGFDERHGYEACKKILSQDRLPDVIFVVTYPVGLGARAALQEADPELPDRIELVSFGAGGFDEFYTYPHYCIQQPTHTMGAEAVRLLLEEIEVLEEEDEMPEPKNISLETRLMVPGESYGRDGAASKDVPTLS
ncbi:MAG: substrate-binding domain-containing protein, partial [Rhodothermales bacterium]